MKAYISKVKKYFSKEHLRRVRLKLRDFWNRSVPLGRRYHRSTLFFFIDRLWCYWIHGVRDTSDYDLYGIYRLREFERRNFFTNGRIPLVMSWFFNENLREEVDSKKGFARNFKEFCKRDILLLPCPENDLLAFARKYGKIFVKKSVSSCGRDVFQYTFDEINNDSDLLKNTAAMDGVAEEPIIQHPVMEELNPSAVSTLRIITMIEKTGDVKILGAGLRIGLTNSYVDNFSQGGCAFEVDTADGIVIGRGTSKNNTKTLRAPTGVIVPGLRIPYWDQVVKMVLTAAMIFPEGRLIGWDVAIGKDGPALVEANNPLGVFGLQFGDYGCWNYLKEQR